MCYLPDDEKMFVQWMHGLNWLGWPVWLITEAQYKYATEDLCKAVENDILHSDYVLVTCDVKHQACRPTVSKRQSNQTTRLTILLTDETCSDSLANMLNVISTLKLPSGSDAASFCDGLVTLVSALTSPDLNVPSDTYLTGVRMYLAHDFFVNQAYPVRCHPAC